jgi:hypothetical protein
MGTVADLDAFSFAHGGPLRRAEQNLRITRDDRNDLARRIAVVVTTAYVPILVAGLASRIAVGDWPRALAELTTHVRVLAVLPLLLLAETTIENRTHEVAHYLRESELVPPERLEAHREALARAARLRDSVAAEIGLVALVLVSALLSPVVTTETAPAVRWALLPAGLWFRFLFLRLLWRWGAWALYLYRLSRLPLALRATHPDRMAGLEPLTSPSSGFAVVVAAASSSVAARWADRMRFEGLDAQAFAEDAATFTVVALLVALAPLLSFSARLTRVWRLGGHAYGAFASRYANAFERRWIGAEGDDALGAPAVQALSDLGGTYERVEHIRVVLVSRATVAALLAGAIGPMLPVLAADVGATTLLLRIAKAFL